MKKKFLNDTFRSKLDIIPCTGCVSCSCLFVSGNKLSAIFMMASVQYNFFPFICLFRFFSFYACVLLFNEVNGFSFQQWPFANPSDLFYLSIINENYKIHALTVVIFYLDLCTLKHPHTPKYSIIQIESIPFQLSRRALRLRYSIHA